MLRKLMCLIGWHEWEASLDDYLKEFGFLGLDDRIASCSKCIHCGAKYKENK